MRTIQIPNNCDYVLPNISIKFSDKILSKTINELEINELIVYKNKIDDVGCHKIWDKAKKLSNNYELIHLPNKKIKSESIALYEPLSRSFFKLWEILVDFNLLMENLKSPLVVAGIAEGPGGFIEAISNYRKKYFSVIDNIYGISLSSTDKDIPGWKKANDYLKNNSNIKIIYGKDGTGNIYNLDNIKYFRDSLVKKAYIVTADGGFDFSIDFNKQEQLSYRIIFCEIVSALSIQIIGGHFVCKFFDLYTLFTLKLIYLLKCFYEEVYITKPLTSRPANSEKYIICKKFKGINPDYLEQLFTIVKTWNIIENNGLYIYDIFDIRLPNCFLETINKYNYHNYNSQIDHIKKTLDIIETQTKLSSLNNAINEQSKFALNWCNKYDIDINYNSSFFK
jgi:23S rRNA U2552 (ribose-2'-O)-methylase RlmE/FtsJ